MTKDDIIKLAREAGFLIDTHAQQYQPNCILSTHGLIDENLQRFAKLVATAEREDCAKMCEELGMATNGMYERNHICATAIRARSDK